MSKSQYNNSNASLGANASFVGTAETTGVYVELAVSMKADKDATVYVEQSVDQLNWDIRSTHLYKTAQGGMTFNVGSKHQWFRVIVVNGASAQGYMRMATYKHEEYTSAVQVGTDGEGIVRKIMTDNTGKLMMTFTGQVGATGMSAYQLALAEGFVGTETAWILSLKGVDGVNGINGSNGFNGSNGANGADGLNGTNGLNGADGINGTDGADGDSAYQVWLGLGNSGTQAQFIQSIKGASILVKGTLTTAEILALNITNLSFGDSYFSSDGFTLYVFNGTSWISSGSLRGVIGSTGNKGDKGDTGSDGESVLVLGNVATASALPNNAQIGHAYFVNDTFSLAVSRGPAVWASSLSLRGVQGEVGPAGGVGPQGGIGAGVIAKGSVADITALNAIPTPSIGDLYIVESDYKMYIWDGTAFQNSGVSMRGTAGLDGADGADGAAGAVGSVGPQGSVGSVGLTGSSIRVISTVAAAVNLPTGYDANDVGKAHFISSLYSLVIWDGSAYVSSESLRGAAGATGNSWLLQGQKATAAEMPGGYTNAQIGWTWYILNEYKYYSWNGAGFIPTNSLLGPQGNTGNDGADGADGSSITLKGEFATVADMGAYPSPVKGDAFFVTENKNLYIYNGVGFVPSGSLQGPQGIQGLPGKSILAKGGLALISDLAPLVATAQIADMYLVTEDKKMYVFDGVAFIAAGASIQGVQGIQGNVGPQGSVGSTGLTGASIRVISTVAAAVNLPTGYDAEDIGKAHFISSLYTLVVWNGSAFVSSDSLRGAVGATGNPWYLAGRKAAVVELPIGYGQSQIGETWYTIADNAYNSWNGIAWVPTDSLKGDKGDAGTPAVDGIDGADGSSITAKGEVATTLNLATLDPAPIKGDAWFVTADKNLYIFNGVSFVASGSLQGVQGNQGFSFNFQGSDYTDATIQGLTLTAADTGKVWLASDTYKLYAWAGSAFTVSGSIRGQVGETGSGIVGKESVLNELLLNFGIAGGSSKGDARFVDENPGKLYIYNGSAWVNTGQSLIGPKGDKGDTGIIATPTIVTYSVASGTAGGQAAGSGVWTTRALNGLVNSTQNGGVSLNTNTITVASAGTYKIEFMGVVYAVGKNKTRLRRTNGSPTTLGIGQNSTASTGNGGHSHNTVTAVLAAGDTLQLEHWVETSANTSDLGQAVSSGENELYARIVIEKLA